MNLFVVLIPFLLISAVFMQISFIETTLPKLATTKQITKKKEKDKLIVSVKVQTRGISIAWIGKNPKPKYQRRWAKGGDLGGWIGKTKKGNYRFKTLNEKMQRIKTAYPNAVSVVIFPSGNTSYETLIKTMDATREINVKDSSGNFTKESLFPDAVIGHVSEAN